MKEILKTGLVLLIICFIGTSALAITNELTNGQIQDQREIKSSAARQAVLPSAVTFEPVSQDELETAVQIEPTIKDIYVGYDSDKNLAGYVFTTTPRGFSKEVETFVGIDVNGIITGVRIGTHEETPGLGKNAENPEFYEQYNGMSTENVIGVSKGEPSENEIQAISGATITSDAITNGVNSAANAYNMLFK